MHVQSLQSCLTVWDPMDSLGAHKVSLFLGILQARILEWVAMPSSRKSSDPGTELGSFTSPALAGGFFTTSTNSKAPSMRMM